MINSPSLAQNPANYGGSIRVVSGDVAIYNITQLFYVIVPGYSYPYFNNNITLMNGSNYVYNQTVGMLSTITIVNTINSSVSSEGFTSTTTISINGQSHTSGSEIGSRYVTDGFTNENSSKSYYAQVIKDFKNSTSETYSYYINGNFYCFISNLTKSNGNSFFSKECWNWNLGWESSYYNIQKFPNGSIITEYQENLINYLPRILAKQPDTPGFTLFTLFPISFLIIVLKIRKRNKNS